MDTALRDTAAALARLGVGSRRWVAGWALVLLADLLALALVAWLAFTATPAGAQVPAEAARWRAELTRQAHAQWGLDAPVPALAAQVHQESGWRADAVSRVGAAGMAQFMPATARWWCEITATAAAECQPRNPRWALRALVGYDKWLFDRLGSAGAPYRDAGHEDQGRGARLWAALRSYNGGLGHWQAESRLAAGPLRHQIDAACGRAKRAAVHCAENLGYPHRILTVLQPRYAAWGPVWPAPDE